MNKTIVIGFLMIIIISLSLLYSFLNTQNEMIRVTSLKPGDKIGSPTTITGQARGMWFFEATFPITLEDEQGNTFVTAIAQANGNWMTENFVPFTATLNFNPGTSTTGTIVFKKDNPSGLPENDAELRIPIKF